ncbi:MAG: hypothetical protein ABII00_07170 [Elusimicrobiota bacterium]
MTKSIAALLALSLAIQPTLVRAGTAVTAASVRTSATPAVAAGAVANALAPATLRLSLPKTPLSSGLPSLATPDLSLPAPMAASPTRSAAAAPVRARTDRPDSSQPAARDAASADEALSRARQAPAAGEKKSPRAKLGRRLKSLFNAVSAERATLRELPAEGASAAANAQIGRLTGEKTRALPVAAHQPGVGAPVEPTAVNPLPSLNPAQSPALLPQSERGPPGKSAKAERKARKASPKPGKKGLIRRIKDAIAGKLRIFKDPQRNKAFWRLFLGEQLYMIGFQMYVVALPYMMKAFTQNNLAEDGRLRDTTAEALNALVRRNRSLARISHWVAQAVSYAAIPLFTKDGKAGPRKWLVRAALIRAAVIAGIPAIFFASGLFTAQTALLVLMGLIAAQSFFQGLYVTMMAGSTARIMGDKSVDPAERIRANSIRSFAAAIVALIAPAIAGSIAGIKDLFGKMGSGSAVIYGIYAASVGLAGLVFATIRMLGQPNDASAEALRAEAAGPKVRGIGGALKSLWTSMVEGVKLIFNNRFLRTLLAISIITSLFADPLIFNVLPEFVETTLAANPAAVEGLLRVPVLGWLMSRLVTTPMGFFAMLVTFSSLGCAIAALLLNPLRSLYKKLGFKTEESLTIPFYIMAFLQVPAFWAMTMISSPPAILLLWGLQNLVVAFSGTVMAGIHQKTLSRYTSKQMNQVLAANSLVTILAAILATYLYGSVLAGIPIATSLLIAAVATTVLGLLRLASPWLLFSRAERRGESPGTPPAKAKKQENARY